MVGLGPPFDFPFDKYEDLSFSESDGETNATKKYMHKFQNKVDFSMKNERQLRDKSDRATTDHALDRRSRAILFKMMNQEIFSEVNGCISTGKEANVYHVRNNRGDDMAVKVYMTSIMPFKSRDKYVKGDFRMRHGYSKATSWKLVSKWVEKEYRNLIRIHQSGLIAAPTPLRLKGVVLLMSFIGKDGIPAPKLKDAHMLADEDSADYPNWDQLYAQIIFDMRTLYQKCRLVHADLSEYNLLFMDGIAWMIDVSQAVEHESPQALEYLRTDCYNINSFFRKKGTATLTLRECFEWIVDPSYPAPDEPQARSCLQTFLQTARDRGINETIENEDDAFRFVHIPRHLSTSYPFIRDFLKLQRGQISQSDVYYAAVTGLKPDLSGALEDIKIEDSVPPSESVSVLCEDTLSNTDSASCCSDVYLEEPPVTNKKSSERPFTVRPRNESPESKKLRKKAVKLEQAEKRKNKIPKHVKRRKVKN